MKNDLKFIGIVQKEDIYATVAEEPWKPMAFDFPPYAVVNPSPNYMFTLGSGNISNATISYGFQYVSGIDLFRHDFNSRNLYESVVNVDHYIAGSISHNQFAVFQTPPQDYHWLKSTDEIVKYAPYPWQYSLGNMLQQGKPPLI